jgi:hypothetical protein
MQAGASIRQHLHAAWRATGDKPAQLETPPVGAMAYLLEWFRDAASGRQSGYAEPCALAWGEIQAWQALTGTRLEPWQAVVLRKLDHLWLRAWRAGREKKAAE